VLGGSVCFQACVVNI